MDSVNISRNGWGIDLLGSFLAFLRYSVTHSRPFRTQARTDLLSAEDSEIFSRSACYILLPGQAKRPSWVSRHSCPRWHEPLESHPRGCFAEMSKRDRDRAAASQRRSQVLAAYLASGSRLVFSLPPQLPHLRDSIRPANSYSTARLEAYRAQCRIYPDELKAAATSAAPTGDAALRWHPVGWPPKRNSRNEVRRRFRRGCAIAWLVRDSSPARLALRGARFDRPPFGQYVDDRRMPRTGRFVAVVTASCRNHG